MKNILIALLLFCSVAASAQKVDLDPYHFNFEYRDLPHAIFDSTLKGYKVTVDISGRIEEFMTTDAMTSKLVLQGLELDESEYNINYFVSFSDLMVDKYQIVESVSESKNKDGTVNKTYSYYISLDYSISGTADLKNYSGDQLIKGIPLFTSRSFNWASKSFSNRSDATSYYYSNKGSIFSNLVRDRLNEGIARANNWANSNVGFPTTKENLYLWLIDNKKHPEYEAMHLRWTALKLTLENVSANTISAEDKSKIVEMIKYFDGLKTTFNKDEKGDKKIRYASFYDNALLYMLIDQPEKAIKETEGLILNGYDAKDAKGQKEQAMKLELLFKNNNLFTRHFSVAGAKPYGIK